MALNGRIGPASFDAQSRASTRSIKVDGSVGGLGSHLRIGRLGLGAHKVSGEVMGQPLSGRISYRRGMVTFTGTAGHEPLHYTIDANGVCMNHDRDLGIRIEAQPLYTELKGAVGRIPDGAMIALLLPVRLTRTDDPYP